MKNLIFFFLLFGTIILGIFFVDVLQSYIIELEHSYLLGLPNNLIHVSILLFLFCSGIFTLYITKLKNLL